MKTEIETKPAAHTPGPHYDLGPENAPQERTDLCVAFARLADKHNALRAEVEKAINWIDLGHSQEAKRTLLKAVGR